MGDRDYYKAGTYNAFCQRCGSKRKADEIKREWTGLYVCEHCFEFRNAQELIRPIADPKPPPWTAPRPPPTGPFFESEDRYTVGGYMVSDAMMG